MDTSYVVLSAVVVFGIAVWFFMVVKSKDFPHMTDEEIAAGDQEFQDSLSDVATPDEYTPAPKSNPGKLTIAIEKVKEATPDKPPVSKPKKNPTPKKRVVVDKTPKKVSRKKKGS